MSTPQNAIDFRIRKGIMLPPDTRRTLHGYKEPLTEVMDGYGYIGTLAYNVAKTHVQCHICGYFFKGLSYHVTKVHGMKTKEYRQRYSLMASTTLMAPATYQKMQEQSKQQIMALAIARLSRPTSVPVPPPKNLETMESKNRKGRCPEQLLRKILILAEELKKTPTRREFANKYGNGGDLDSIYRTFGTWNRAVAELGLTPNLRGR